MLPAIGVTLTSMTFRKTSFFLGELFGHEAVFQLAPEREGKGRVDTAAELLPGRFLFAADMTHRTLDERLRVDSS